MKKGTKGAITVFLAIIFTSMIFLTGTIIDLTRIYVAKRKVQSSLNTAARSALSHYDKTLSNEYQMFGVKNNNIEADVEDYLYVNLKNRNKSLNYINYKIENVSAEGMANLLNDDIFKRQIIETMKYKGPALIAKNIIDQFRNAGIDKTDEIIKNREKLLGKGSTAKEAIDEVKDIWKDANPSLKKGIKKGTKLGDNDTLGEGITKRVKAKVIKDMGDFAQDNLDYWMEERMFHEQIETDYRNLNDLSSKIERYKESLQDYEETIEKDNEVVSKNSELNISSLNQSCGKQDIDSIDALSKRIESNREKIKLIKERMDRIERKIKNISNSDLSDDEKSEIIEEKRQELDDLLYDFELEPIDVDEIFVPKFEPYNVRTHPHNNKDHYGSELAHLQYKIKDTLKIFPLEDEWTSGIDDEEGKSSIRSDIDSFENMYSKSKDVPNKIGFKAAIKKINLVKEFMSGIFKLLVDTANTVRDKMYIVEYIMDKYTFITTQTARTHYFSKSETEYILFGRKTQVGNILAGISSVGLMRFCFDFIDEFLTNPDGELITRVGYSVVEGGIRAVIDLYDLLRGKNVPTFNKLTKLSGKSIKLRYSDHLRLLLLLEPEKRMFNNMRKMMQVNTINQDINSDANWRVKNFNTIVHAKADVSINLWFIPMFHFDKLGFENFKDDKYIVHKEIYVGY